MTVEGIRRTPAGGDGVAPFDDPGTTLLVDAGEAMALCEDRLSFGRSADLILDESNRFMHRCVGNFRRENQGWWVDNLAHRHQLVVFGSDGTRRAIAAGMSRRLSAPVGTINFAVGPALYALTYYSPAQARRWTRCDLDLSTAEIDVLLELARPWLSGSGRQISPFAAAAQATQLRPRTISRLLDRRMDAMAGDFIGAPRSVEELIVRLVAFGQITLPQLIKRSIRLNLNVPKL